MAYEPLLLIPGVGETRDLFQPQIAAFSGRADCIVASHGRYQDIRMDAGAILAEAPQKFALAGHSMGGYLALEIMRRAPERVTRLALISTRAGIDTEEERERRLELIRMAEEGEFEAIQQDAWPRFVHPGNVGNQRLEGIFKGMMAATGPERFALQQRAVMNRMGFWGVLPSISVPTAVIVGDQDMITRKSSSTAMQAAIRGAELTVISRCGHLAPLEQPQMVNGALDRWLARKPLPKKGDDWPDALKPFLK